MTESQKLWNQVIDPGLRGAGSGLLFDIPEWVAKQIDREATEKYIKENEGMYRGGQLAGTVAGAFIPVGGLAAKGVQALAKGAQAGSALAKAGQVARSLDTTQKGLSLGQKLLRGAAGGALESGLESGVRAAAGERDNILGETVQGAAFGGALGGLGAGLQRSRDVIGEGLDMAQKATTGAVGLTSRNLRQAYQKLLPRASGGRVMEDLSEEMGPLLAKKAREWNLLPEVGRDDRLKEVYNTLSAQYKKIDNLAEKNREVLQAMTPDLGAVKAEILDDFGPGLGAGGREMLEGQLDRLIANISFDRPLPEVRNTLQKAIERGMGQNAQPGQIAQAEMAKIVRQSLDDAVDSLVETTGDAGLKSLAKDWKAYRVLSEAVKLDEFADWGRKSGGSPTFEKAALGAMMGLGGGAASGDWSDPEKLQENLIKSIGASALGAAAPKFSQGLTSGILARATPALEKLSEVADPELLRKIGEGVSALGPGIAGKLPGAQAGVDRLRALEDERANPEVNRGRTQFDTALLQGVAQQLFQAGIPPEQIRTLTPRLLESLSPEARIQIALPKEMQKDALTALEMSKALDLIPTIATGSPLERARAQGAIYQAIGKATGGNTELKRAADKEARKILSQPIADSRKRALISDLLASLDPAVYSTFREMGVVK